MLRELRVNKLVQVDGATRSNQSSAADLGVIKLTS